MPTTPGLSHRGCDVRSECNSSGPCGPQPRLNNCAAGRRYLRRLAQSATPAAAEDKFYPKSSACGYLSRAVRRRPTAADCCRIPTAVGEQHSKNRKYSPQACAGRSLPPAEARNSLCVRLRLPQATARKHSQAPAAAEDKFCPRSSVCGSLSRTVRGPRPEQPHRPPSMARRGIRPHARIMRSRSCFS